MTAIQIADETIEARTASTLLEKSRGHMFRTSEPDYALVFPFDGSVQRLHMLFVPFALDAVFVVDGEVEQVSRMRPWIGYASGRADAVIELPAGAVDVDEGDRVELAKEESQQ